MSDNKLGLILGLAILLVGSALGMAVRPSLPAAEPAQAPRPQLTWQQDSLAWAQEKQQAQALQQAQAGRWAWSWD